MVRGRRNAKRDAAAPKAAAQRARETASADAVDRLASNWGSERGAHDRLSAVSSELERLHRQEAALLRERDELVSVMRVAEVSLVHAEHADLSRQALMERL